MNLPDDLRGLVDWILACPSFFSGLSPGVVNYERPFWWKELSQEHVQILFSLAKEVLAKFNPAQEREHNREVLAILLCLSWVQQTEDDLTEAIVDCLGAYSWKIRSMAFLCLEKLGRQSYSALTAVTKKGIPPRNSPLHEKYRQAKLLLEYIEQ